MSSYDKSRLVEIGKKNEQAELDCLKKIISIPTCYYKNHDSKLIIAFLTAEFKKRGYAVQTFPTAGAPIIVADLDRKAKRTLLFYNHYDVQPEEPLEEWKSPPYELSIRGERLYGRGVLDNKGPLVANMFGVQNALEADLGLNCNVRFIIEGEEEAGSIHLEEFCMAHPNLLKSDGCIWEWANAVPNQRSRIYAGVKGDAYFEFHAKGFFKDAHSGDAPIVINPAWRLVWALSTLKSDKEKILIDGFYDDVVPVKKEEQTLIKRYPPEEIEEFRDQYKTKRFLLGREGVNFWKELVFSPTCSICGLSAGWEGPGSKTVIGKEATAKVDFRLVPNQNAEKIQKLLRRHLDNHGFSDIEVRLLEGYGPSKTAIDHPFIQLLAKLAKDFSDEDPIIFPSHQGSGPAYLFGNHTPWAMCDIFDPDTNIHAPNESIRLRDFRYMTAFIAAAAIKLGKS
jgi:acetylornithine deacetylase/succinyl-diaminopimelate desuccinylase-like protein